MLTKKLLTLSMSAAILILTPNIHANSLNSIIKEAKTAINGLNTNEINKVLEKNPNIPVIDVRSRLDILNQGGYLKVNNYTNIPRGKLEFLISQNVKKDEEFIVYCYSGDISLLAAKKLKEIGYKNVIWYKDSFKGWSEAKQNISSLDFYTQSPLYRPLEKVADGVYTSIGATQPATYENFGHNNNLGFIVGEDSVLVWNAGANYMLAKAFHEEIKKITDKPIKYVILENSQGHAMLGSSYWKEQGAKIVSQSIAKYEIINKGEQILSRHQRTYKDKALGTKIVTPDIIFEDNMKFDLGNRIVEAKYFGYAHEHSDIMVWLPKEKIAFAGDLAFHQRLLPIFEITEIDKWLIAWEKLEALKPKIVIPGHGDVTTIDVTREYTKGYLVYLKEQIENVLDEDGELLDAYNINMDDYKHLDTYKELGRQNIARVFKKMEFE